MRVSVVVPAYGRTDLLSKAIVSLIDQDFDPDEYEVIVVDSSPDDGNRQAVEQLQASARCPLRCVVKPPEGPGPSRNLGAAQARGSFFAFIDSDCRADPQWLRRTLAAFEPGVGLVQGKTLPDPAGRLGVFTHYPLVERESFVYECTNIVYRRDAFEQAGGFPGDLHPEAQHPLGGEDVELAWTVKRLGWRSRFADDSIVYHEVLPISIWRWLFVKQLFIWPYLAGRYPELRQFFVGRYLWDTAQALYLCALAGVLLAWLATPWMLLLGAPYAAHRGLARSASFPGPLRPLRIVPYIARDSVWFLLLAAGSLRWRSLLL
jgi:glycosyltransferase involved in cell wall biosynthesis